MSRLQEQVLVLRSFLTPQEQSDITDEILTCHARNVGADRSLAQLLDNDELETSPRSIKLNLGVSTGGCIAPNLPNSERVCRRVFQHALQVLVDSSGVRNFNLHPLRALAEPETPLTGTALLYGPSASMKPHYDSPTQPNQKEEWLLILSLGLAMTFRCNDATLRVDSGDALVMDSMAVLHGVEEILPSDEDASSELQPSWRRVGLPAPSRLGLVVWQGRSRATTASISDVHTIEQDSAMEGMDALFEEGEVL